MRRVRLVPSVGLALALLAAPLAAEAQPAGKVYRVALILTTSPISEMAGPEPLHPASGRSRSIRRKALVKSLGVCSTRTKYTES